MESCPRNTAGAAALAGDRATADIALATQTTDLRTLAPAFAPVAVNAEIYFCLMHPDFLSANPTAHCDKCGHVPREATGAGQRHGGLRAVQREYPAVGSTGSPLSLPSKQIETICHPAT